MIPQPHWKKIVPGVYEDTDSVHIVTEEICRHLGLPHTKEMQDLITEQAKIACRERGVKAMVSEVWHE